MQRLGVTGRTVRFYETVGLLSADRDSLNRRVFDTSQLWRLAEIRRLREVGIGLREISQILEKRGSDAWEAEVCQLLEVRREKLSAQIAQIDELTAAITPKAEFGRATETQVPVEIAQSQTTQAREG